MLIDVNKWIDKNGSFDEAGGLDLVRHGYEWIRRMRKFEKVIIYQFTPLPTNNHKLYKYYLC